MRRLAWLGVVVGALGVGGCASSRQALQPPLADPSSGGEEGPEGETTPRRNQDNGVPCPAKPGPISSRPG